MKKLHKTISLITAACFYFASTSVYASIPPMSLSQMYEHAATGNVRALRAAVQRGLNIDTMDRNGNTGLCHAILKNDKTAYNAFRAAGANPRHGCTINNISRRQYEAFMNNPSVASETTTPRGAYAKFNEGEYVISKKTWIIGGLLLVAAGVGIALAGGGGGSSGGGSGSYFVPTDDSLAGFAGTSAPSEAPSGYQPILISAVEGETKTSSSVLAVTNDNYHIDGSTNAPIGDFLNFNGNILKYAKYIKVGMKAVANATVINNSTITLSNATAGMSSVGGGASAINNSLIQMTAGNGSIGMIAGEKATATNADRILMSFQGEFETDQVIGMYGDTGATITNNNMISTYTSGASDIAKAGKIIGMAGRLINQEQNPNIANATRLVNSAGSQIRLSMVGDTQAITTNLIGMGSFIDQDFISGIKLLSRAGFIDITNNGTIDLTLSLISGSVYTANNLRQNTGGIIGILADANTTATNSSSGIININILTTNESDVTGGHAGMLSKHGGIINNNGTISVTGGVNGYGMLAIRGEGSNSEFDSMRPTLLNSGIININSEEGYGMASFHGGTVTNTNQINMLKAGSIGMHSNAGTVTNDGTITLSNGGIGINIGRNEVGEGSTNYNTSNTKVTNSSTGKIIIQNADSDSYGIKSEYGTVENNGNISLTSGATVSASSSGEYASGIFLETGNILNSGKVYVEMNVDAVTTLIYGLRSTSANIINLVSGEIEFKYRGVGIDSQSGAVTNNGSILLRNGGIGINTVNGNVVNNGTIEIKSEIQSEQGGGIISANGIIQNAGKITIDGHNSRGIDSGGIVINEAITGEILVKGQNGTGIALSDGAKLTNNGKITVENTLVDGDQHYGVKAEGITTIINNSDITLVGRSSYGGVVNVGYGISAENGTIRNDGIIDITGFYGYGIKTAGGIATNANEITMTNGGYGMYGEDGSSLVNDVDGVITITDTRDEDPSFGMYTNGGTARNAGKISIDDKKSTGISANDGHGINEGTIEMLGDESVGMSTTGSNSTLRNITGGTIDIDGDRSFGVKMDGGTFTNEGEINLKGNDGYGIYLTSGTAINRGVINSTGSGNVAIYTETGTIDNYSPITLSQGTAIEVAGAGTAKNYSDIKVTNGSGMVGSKAGATLYNMSDGKIEMGTGIGMDVTGSGSTATNNGSIIFTGTSGSGITAMKASDGATAKNTKTITLTEGTGMSAKGAGSKVENNGTITSAGSTNAMETDEGEAYNNGTIKLTGTDALGMYATKGKIINTSTIEMNNGGTGMKVIGTGTGTNSGTIVTTSTVASYGMYTQSGALVNEATGNINLNIGTGIYATNTTAETKNYGTITITGSSISYGMYAQNGVLINETTGNINLNIGTGIYATGSTATATNNGTITITGSSGSYGMAAYAGASVTNSNNGKINIGNGGIAMYASGIGSKAINKGSLKTTDANRVLMSADNGTIINDTGGKLELNTGNAMYATGSSARSSNKGEISITGNASSYGMASYNGAISVNDTTGIISVGGNGRGMFATGAGSIISNKGTISVTGSTGYGMYASGGAFAINEAGANINMDSGATGIYGTGAGTKVYNLGTISIGSNSCSGIACETDTGASYITLAGGATFENVAFTFSSFAMNFSSFTADDLSKVVVGKGGTFEAPELSGTVYASSGIVEDGFEKTYVNENSFVGEDTGIDLKSNSYMFNARLKTNEDGGSDVVMEMKDFGDIVSNGSVSKFLTQNYSLENGENLFKILKSANNQNDFGRVLNNQLGLDFFPSFARQSIEVIRSLNRQMNNTVFMNNDPREVTAMMGYDFVDKNQERSGVVEGYEETAQSVYSLVEKKHNQNIRYGAGITLTKVDSKYDNSSKRDEILAHILAPVKYDGNGYSFVSIPRIGYGWGDYERNASGTIHKADTRSYYYGVTNEFRKDVDLGLFTLEPTAEFNILGVYQDRIKENNQLTIKSNNSLSIEGGLGVYAKKAWRVDENNSFAVRFGGTMYQEFGNAYSGARAEMAGMNGSYKMKGYETDRTRGVVTGRADYRYNSINFFGEAGKTIERDNAYEFKAGISVNF